MNSSLCALDYEERNWVLKEDAVEYYILQLLKAWTSRQYNQIYFVMGPDGRFVSKGRVILPRSVDAVSLSQV